MKTSIKISAILPLVFIACYVAPTPIFRMETVEDNNQKFWLHGREYTRLIAKKSEVIIAFDGVAGNRITFNIEILNNDSASIIVSPDLFTGYYLNSKMEPIPVNAKYNAIDPETEILEIDKTLSRENARYAGESGTKALFSLFDLAADIATIGEPKTEREIREEQQQDLERQIQDERNKNYHFNTENSLSYKKSKWESDALRKTTLPPDYSVSGKLVFPFKSYSHFMKVIFNEGDDNKQIIFKINKIESD